MSAVTDLIRRLEEASPDIQDIRAAVLLVLQQWETPKKHEDLAQKLGELTDVVRQLATGQTRTEESLQKLAQAQKGTEESIEKLTQRVDQLAERVAQLAEQLGQLVDAQRRTEERLEKLTQRVDELAQAQKLTEERVEQLAEAQKRTEQTLHSLIKEFKGFKKTLGGITDAVGYGLEDHIISLVPAFAAREYDLQVKAPLRRFIEYPDGRTDELNIYAEGLREGKPLALIGECKSQPGKNDLRNFARKVERLKRHLGIEVEPFLVGYSITPEVARFAAAEYPHITLYWSYQFEILRESSR